MSTVDPERVAVETLDDWVGRRVGVRITRQQRKELIAVFSGRLRERSEEKKPSLFWPIENSEPPEAERPGIYIHPGSLTGGRLHEGKFVVELEHGLVTTNVRLLDRSPARG